MNPHLHFRLHGLPHFAGLFSFATVLLVANIAFDTLIDDRAITMHQGTARAWNNSQGLVVEYQRGFTVHRDGLATLQRIVICPPSGDEQVFLDYPPITRTFHAGEYAAVIRPLQFPAKVKDGTLCKLQTWGNWRRTWSITDRRYLLDEIEFVVGQ